MNKKAAILSKLLFDIIFVILIYLLYKELSNSVLYFLILTNIILVVHTSKAFWDINFGPLRIKKDKE